MGISFSLVCSYHGKLMQVLWVKRWRKIFIGSYGVLPQDFSLSFTELKYGYWKIGHDSLVMS